MKLDMFQKIRLKDGRFGHIVEIFNDGEAYMVDIQAQDGEYETETIYPKDIKSVVVEVEEPFPVAM
ncbi:MAG: hypothetical protein LBR76_06820 [Oscillospiraceae bacterium]|jgi:hypothetical protein|nr:hypothetical protein [Oscillospiraceae bacterium]